MADLAPLTPPALVRAPPADPLVYVEDRDALIAGNEIRLLRNGVEVFPAWLDAIGAARERVSLEMYIFNDDTIGKKFGDALAAAAARGVTVRLLYDFIGCRDASPGFFPRLREAGVHVIAYHRYRFWRPRFWAVFRRNHRKTLVCDGEVAFSGGLNIADEWLPLADGGGGWKDAAVEVRGPAVQAMEAVFLQTWNRRSPRRVQLQPEAVPVPPRAGATPLAVVSNTELRERFAIRRAALHVLRESRQRIRLVNPYFVPDGGILRALCQAARRGVDVRLLVPEESDALTLDYAARATFGRLLAAGVRIFQSRAVVHTKALSVDDVFVSVGSYNLDHRSLAYNLEMVVNAIDPTLATAVDRMLDQDMAESEEILADDFDQRSAFARVLEYLAYGLRRWLWSMRAPPLLLLALAWAGCTPRARPPAAVALAPAVHGLAEVGFLVSDVEQARAFYVDLLGLTARPGRDGALVIEVSAGQTVELRAGGASQGIDGRLDHVSFYADVAGVQAALGAAAVTELRDGSRVLRAPDPDGHALVFIEAPPARLALETRTKPLPADRIATHMAHVGVLTGGLTRALRFYATLGLIETWRGSADGHRLDWVNLAAPASGDYLELMLYQTLPPPDQRGGKHHLCLFTPDLARAVAWLEARPARRRYPRAIEIKVGKNHKRQANLFDPDGTRVELMEPHTADGQVTPPSPAPPPQP